jgi:hypothetical protein
MKMYAHANASGRARTPPAANTMVNRPISPPFSHADTALTRYRSLLQITMVTYGSQLAAPYASSADDDWFSQIPEYSEDWKKELDEELNSIVLDQPVVTTSDGKE